MTDSECRLLALLRAREPAKASVLGLSAGLPIEALYGALVRLEANGLARVRVDHNPVTTERTVMWETA